MTTLPAKLQNKTWKCSNEEPLTSDDLSRVLEGVEGGHDAAHVLKSGYASRRVDKALQLLRKAGLIRYRDRKWEAVK